jgi:dipeptidyl aminopeptidase/acylaminoacyl peptidase
VWAEALDGGNPGTKVDKHDRVRMLAAPFTGEAATLADLEYRFAGMTWARDDLAIIDEFWQRTRRARSWAVDPSAPGKAGRTLFDVSSEDRYGDPGSFETMPGPFGRQVMMTSADGRFAYLNGDGASPDGDRPFLDRYELATGKTERLFRSESPYFEGVVDMIDRDGRRVITRRESVNEAPNYFLRDLQTKTATALTKFADPAPQFAGVSKQLITYKRNDGVQLSATLYLPPNYDKTRDGPLPFFLWAYPQEFLSASAASQVTGSPHRFTRPGGSSHLFLLTQGYGVLDGPTMPIIGENGTRPNDKYIPQLVASAQAAVDEIVRLGVADRDRVAIGGHSYGAFMAANVLSHSNIFKAGIARSGAYNRTLTPFGFQAEERNYWQARDVYTSMSPFTYADSVSAPILLIHGQNDDNQGTFPVQSERYFAALKGHGKQSRLVMLPAEPHGYRARESNGHVLWEMVTWLDRFVKGKPRA